MVLEEFDKGAAMDASEAMIAFCPSSAEVIRERTSELPFAGSVHPLTMSHSLVSPTSR